VSNSITKPRVRLKYLAHLEMGQSPPSGEYSLLPEDGLPFLQGTAEFGLHFPVPRVYCSSPSKVAMKGDILFSVRAPVGELNVANTETGIGRGLCAIHPSTSLDTRFAWWALYEARHQLNYVSTGSTYEAVSAEDVANLLIVQMPTHKQSTIADYLDREMVRLDALVTTKERLLELLAEKRRGLITYAVTRGLHSDAPLQNSGIDWLGAIPVHWELKRAKWLFQERDERSTTGEEVLLSLRMERGLIPHNEVSEKLTRSEELIGYKKVATNEIVVNRMRAASGLIAVSPQDGLVSPDYAVFKCASEVDQHYFTYLFKTELLQAIFRSESTGLGTGASGFLRLYSDSFLSLWFPYPPFHEQRAIVDHIVTATAKLDALRSATERTIALLKERRAALITLAVTGQLNLQETL
jgi:type I restriction enzyme, S subunit